MQIQLGNTSNGLKFVVTPILPLSDKQLDALIELTVTFEIEDFQTQCKVLISENEVHTFKEGLLSLYHNYSERFSFTSINKDLEITLKAFPEGIISVTGFVIKKPYNLRLKFKLFFDLEQIPVLNLSLKKTLHSLKSKA